MVGTVQVLMADEISTGLDSATTFQIMARLKNLIQLDLTIMVCMQCATVDWADLFTNKQVALLQPAPETVALFDDVLLLSDGHVAYHGPLQDMLSYFEGLGFMRPADVSLQEWVQELTGPVDQEVRCMFIRNCLSSCSPFTEVLGTC